jgi:hypothetical protein
MNTCHCAWRRRRVAASAPSACISATTGAGWRASTCSTTASTALHCPARSRAAAARTWCWRAPATRCAIPHARCWAASRKPGWRRVWPLRARTGTSWPSRRRWRSRAACRSSLPRTGASGPTAGTAIRWRGGACWTPWRGAARAIPWCWRETCTPFMRASCGAISTGRYRRPIRSLRRNCAAPRLPRARGPSSAPRRMSSAIRTCCTGAATGAATC